MNHNEVFFNNDFKCANQKHVSSPFFLFPLFLLVPFILHRSLRRITLIGRLVSEENEKIVVEIGVQDTGVGISTKDKTHLFEP